MSSQYVQVLQNRKIISKFSIKVRGAIDVVIVIPEFDSQPGQKNYFLLNRVQQLSSLEEKTIIRKH